LDNNRFNQTIPLSRLYAVPRSEIVQKTGYQDGSVGAYIRNKLKNVYLFETQNKRYEVRGLLGVTYESFSYYMSKKSHEVEDRDDSLYLSLRNRSLQAFYAALGIYNNPIQKYRVESFCILLANAWELLLKARLVQLKGEQEIERKDGKTISLVRAVELLFSKPKDPVRRNIETINELREKAVHLLVPDIQKTLSRIFQSSVLNYLLNVNEFGYPNLYAGQLPGLLSLVSEYDDLSEAAIGNKYGELTKDHVKRFLEGVHDEERALESNQFAIPMQYKIVLTITDNLFTGDSLKAGM
jgi:hypothetical protein